ncbi:hypothetical protein [Oceanobacillus oncorhynchi]|uniref:hypothetical protein n=1 Tax=Oceanobacillus oncorhynchi TaxID=545501 RepID=UPI0018681E83|nr:hypothetical protein [Oceanobacillus oncorhynchi]
MLTKMEHNFYKGHIPKIPNALEGIQDEMKRSNHLKEKELELKEYELELNEKEFTGKRSSEKDAEIEKLKYETERLNKKIYELVNANDDLEARLGLKPF